MDQKDHNAGVTSGKIKFCDLRCEHASFPKDADIDGSRSCKTYMALWCNALETYVTKNAPCAMLFGQRRPKSSW